MADAVADSPCVGPFVVMCDHLGLRRWLSRSTRVPCSRRARSGSAKRHAVQGRDEARDIETVHLTGIVNAYDVLKPHTSLILLFSCK